jgi:uncharacterized protein YqhQ
MMPLKAVRRVMNKRDASHSRSFEYEINPSQLTSQSVQSFRLFLSSFEFFGVMFCVFVLSFFPRSRLAVFAAVTDWSVEMS